VEGAVNRTGRTKAGAVLVALLTLALLSSRASPGFPLADVPRAVGKSIAKALGAKPGRADRSGEPAQRGASSFALADIPKRYLGFYSEAAATCRGLTWQVLAAIGKIESDHGRSSAPGVKSGVNRFGCCAGPMQFNIRNGRPSTWDTWGTGVVAQVYDPAHAVPAAARKLCGDGLAQPERIRQDPCPNVLGSAALHVAVKRYNNACWYVHEVVTLAGRYTSSAPPPAPSKDPFVRALVANQRITTTTSHGCNPRADLASGRLDLRVQSLLAARLVVDAGWTSTTSMSTARQTVWLEMRVVPLTKREWPVRRQLSRMVWRSARTASSDWTRRSSRPEARSTAGLQPWLVVVVIRVLATRARTNGSRAGASAGAARV
jgi:hypothetical protein